MDESRKRVSPALMLTFGLRNAGTRPTSRLRVSFEARGNIWLQRKDEREDDEDRSEASTSRPAPRPIPSLPVPARAPAFRRTVKSAPAPVGRGLAALNVPKGGLRVGDLAGFGSALDGMKGMRGAMVDIERLGMTSRTFGMSGTMNEITRHAQEHERLFGSVTRLRMAAGRSAQARRAHLRHVSPSGPRRAVRAGGRVPGGKETSAEQLFARCKLKT